MKILLIGDTHGKLNKLRDIFPKLKNIDLIAHTGDLHSDAIAIKREFNLPIISVKGNCDGAYSHNDFKIIKTEFGDIFLTHGHMENVNYNLNTLMYKALENNCIAAFFGHTHRSLYKQENGFYFVNPGSLTLPRDNSDGSYAVINTTAASFNAGIVYYSTAMGKTSKANSGYIRDLLNNSDRF